MIYWIIAGLVAWIITSQMIAWMLVPDEGQDEGTRKEAVVGIWAAVFFFPFFLLYLLVYLLARLTKWMRTLGAESDVDADEVIP